MKTLVAGPKSPHVGQKCVLCPRQVKAGEAIIVDVVQQIRFGAGRTRRTHVCCMQRLIDGAPAGVDELNACRAGMLAASDAFA